MHDDAQDSFSLGRAIIAFSFPELSADNLSFAFTGAQEEEPEESAQPNFSETIRKVRY